jgi:hypothetical protein
MRDYQIRGLNWLISLYENGINGILADEMVNKLILFYVVIKIPMAIYCVINFAIIYELRYKETKQKVCNM